jgi:plastocyanin
MASKREKYMKITSVVIITTAFLFGFSFITNYVVATDSKVSVGGNGSLWDSFTPQNVEIKSGESVTWRNPMVVSEPHTVSFILDPEYFAPPVAPFSISDSVELKSLLPNPNIDPNMVDHQNGTRTVIVDNARQSNPVIVDNENNATYLPINSDYSMDGSEKYINSGWMWPEGLAPPGASPISNFTVIFEKPGTYNYICSIHPWMTGSVIVQ